MNCPFCPPQLEENNEIREENEHGVCIPTNHPVLEGSQLILPRSHRTTVFALTPEEWRATRDLMKQAKRRIDEKWSPDGYNAGWNIGRAGGQDVFHAHMHLIPRYAEEPLAGRGIRYWIKQEANLRTNGNTS